MGGHVSWVVMDTINQLIRNRYESDNHDSRGSIVTIYFEIITTIIILQHQGGQFSIFAAPWQMIGEKVTYNTIRMVCKTRGPIRCRP